MSAVSMPIEQDAMPWLRGVNRDIGWSIRAFSNTDINELQFIAFTSSCQQCGLISWWDLEPAELEDALNNPESAFKIAWTYKPETLMEIEEKLSPERKWVVRKILMQLHERRSVNAKPD